MATVSIMVGAALAILKLGAGWLAGSLAVLADGVESAGDVVASTILWLGLMAAARPADENHPYGHGRYETLAGQAIGAFLVVSGGALVWGALHRVGNVHAMPQSFAIWTLVVSVAVKLALARWKRSSAQSLGSAAMQADANNDWLDVLSGLVAMGALGLTLWRPLEFRDADAWGGALVGGLVVVLGLGVLREASTALLDTMPEGDKLEEVRCVARLVPGAWDIEKVRARKTGFQYHVDLHLEVDPDSSVEAAHRVGGAVRQRLRDTIPWVADVLIHIEPGERKGSENSSHG